MNQTPEEMREELIESSIPLIEAQYNYLCALITADKLSAELRASHEHLAALSYSTQYECFRESVIRAGLDPDADIWASTRADFAACIEVECAALAAQN